MKIGFVKLVRLIRPCMPQKQYDFVNLYIHTTHIRTYIIMYINVCPAAKCVIESFVPIFYAEV